MSIPNLQLSACIAARYSQRRTVSSPGGKVRLINFTTSHIPILTALARSFVLNAFYKSATEIFSDQTFDPRIRHGIAAAMKVVAIQHVQEANLELSERCGNQGLFGHNQISTFHAEQRGTAIAEGDLLGLSIHKLRSSFLVVMLTKLAGLSSELLLGCYQLPTSTHPESPLAKHEEALLDENRAIIISMAHHRKDDFNRLILPRCQAIVEAIGLRIAYDAGLDAGLDTCITDVYLAAAIKRDSIWYSENLGITRATQSDAERKAFDATSPKLDAWLELADVDRYVRAPIVSAEKWSQFVDGLEVFSGGNADPMVSPVCAHLW